MPLSAVAGAIGRDTPLRPASFAFEKASVFATIGLDGYPIAI